MITKKNTEICIFSLLIKKIFYTANTGPVSNTSSAMTSQYQQITANQSKMIFQQAMANMAQHKSPNPVASPNSNASFDKGE